MTTTYTSIASASTTYTKKSGGYHLYDDVEDTYDDSTVTYDGMNNMSSYTNITKASGTTYTKITKAT